MSSRKDESVIPSYSGELPTGWSSATLPELTINGIFSDGDWVETKDQNEDGKVRLIQLADIGENNFKDKSDKHLTIEKANELDCTLLHQGDILIARMPDPLGRATIFPGKQYPCVTAVDVCIVRSGGLINHGWLMHFLNSPSVRSVVNELESGTTRKRISRKNLAKIEIPVPPQNEQDRIENRIDELFSKLNSGTQDLKDTKRRLERYSQSLLNAAMTGQLTEDWRKRENPSPYPEELINQLRREKWEEIEYMKRCQRGKKPENDDWKEYYSEPEYSDASLNDIPESWQAVTIDQIGIVQSGKTPKGIKEVASGGEIPWFKVGDMNTPGNEKYLKHSEFSLTEKDSKELKLYLYPKNTVVFPKRGGAIKTNKKRLLDGKSSFDLNTMAVISAAADSEFLYYWFQSFDLMQVADGSNVPQINHGDIKPRNIPLPPEIEQEIIVEKLDRKLSITQELENIVQNELNRAERLRKAILRRAFTGELVPQDPEDEPAEKLLDRIESTMDHAKQNDQMTLSEVSQNVE